MAINPIPFTRDLISFAEEYGDALVEELKFKLANKDKFATGNLVDSMFSEAAGADGKAVVRVFAAAYFRYVEVGRSPGARMPPEEPIRQWLRVRGIDESKQFVIRRAIARRGIKGVHIVNPTIEEINQRFLPKYSKQLANLVGVTMVNDVFSQTNTKGQIIPKKLR